MTAWLTVFLRETVTVNGAVIENAYYEGDTRILAAIVSAV